MPTADFSVKFLVQRNSGSTVIRFTDASTATSFTAGNFKVTYPDGSVVQNTDYGSPDISAKLGTVDYTLKVNSDNSPLTGNYTVLYTIIADSSQDVESKTFNFEWVEPEVLITNTSDVAVPEVKFKDTTDYDQGNFTEAYNTWTLAADAPSTSDASGDTATANLTTSARELDAVYSSSYYEGSYAPTATLDITWTSSVYAYLTVNWTKVATETFAIKKAQSQSDIIALLNTYKSELSSGQKEEYDYVVSLYSHLLGRAETGTLDGSEDILNELLDYIDTSSSYTYQSGPISAFSYGGFVDISGTPSADTLTGWVDSNTVKEITVGSGLTLASGELSASGSGDIAGPASSTNNAIARFDGTTGKILQNSTATVDDNGYVRTDRVIVDGELTLSGSSLQTATTNLSIIGDLALTLGSTDGSIIFKNGLGITVASLDQNGTWDYQGNNLTNVADPVNPQDVVTKAYGDANYTATTSPSGSDGQLQYNNGGSFGGASVEYDDSNESLVFTGAASIGDIVKNVDNDRLLIGGGNIASTSGGAVIELRGNNASSPGEMRLLSGTNGDIQFFQGNTRIATLNENGIFPFTTETSDLGSDALKWNDLFISSLTVGDSSAAGVVELYNATTVPSVNLTNGGSLYVEGGALKYRGSGGTITTIGPA